MLTESFYQKIYNIILMRGNYCAGVKDSSIYNVLLNCRLLFYTVLNIFAQFKQKRDNIAIGEFLLTDSANLAPSQY